MVFRLGPSNWRHTERSETRNPVTKMLLYLLQWEYIPGTVHLKPELILHNDIDFTFYFTQMMMSHHYYDQTISVVQKNNSCLFCD
jgi:hypothetical protein